MSQNKVTTWIIKTWKERIQADIDAGSLSTENRQNVKSKHMAAEIADLRAALATAPQVIADERAAFESAQRKYHSPMAEADLRQDKIGNYYSTITQANWSMWQSRAALQAAPVQAQEPVAEIHCQEFHELAMDYRGAQGIGVSHTAYTALCDYINRRLAAPVQPVAVPSSAGRCQERRTVSLLA